MGQLMIANGGANGARFFWGPSACTVIAQRSVQAVDLIGHEAGRKPH